MWLSNAGILFSWTCYAYIIRKFCTAPDNFTKDLLGLLPYFNCFYGISYHTLNWRTNSMIIIYQVLWLRKIFLLILTCIGSEQKNSTQKGVRQMFDISVVSYMHICLKCSSLRGCEQNKTVTSRNRKTKPNTTDQNCHDDYS